jgi:hypothetical protein
LHSVCVTCYEYHVIFHDIMSVRNRTMYYKHIYGFMVNFLLGLESLDSYNSFQLLTFQLTKMSSNLNRDILYLIFKKLQNDKKTLYSSLSVNKTCGEIIIPILWRNPWKYLTLTNKKRNLSLLFNVIISHLSDESKSNLKFNQSIDFLYQKPLFNYISFCKHLNLRAITKIINSNCSKYEINISIVKNEIFKLFINENTRFTHLYLPQHFDYQIHLIPGAKQCFSEIVFLSCF